MIRIKLERYDGYWDGDTWITNRDVVKVYMPRSKSSGKLHVAYINDPKKLKEMEEDGYAYINRSEALVSRS